MYYLIVWKFEESPTKVEVFTKQRARNIYFIESMTQVPSSDYEVLNKRTEDGATLTANIQAGRYNDPQFH